MKDRARPLRYTDLTPLGEKLALTCAKCGHTDDYSVGTVSIDPDWIQKGAGFFEDAVGFTAYLRCRSCDAPGPWGLPPKTHLLLMSLLLDIQRFGKQPPFFVGKRILFDGKVIRYATEGEEHLKDLIAKDPRNAPLWNRLGNLYRSAERDDLAKESYRKALELDRSDIESHHSLGEILLKEGDLEASAKHIRRVLNHARERQDVGEGVRRDLVRGALSALVILHERSRGKIEVFPPPDPDVWGEGGEDLVVRIRESSLSSQSDWEDLVSMICGEARPTP